LPAKSKTSLLDVNALAIYLVEDHPGHPYVAPIIDAGLAGRASLLAPDQLPLRARWVMTTRWKLPKKDVDDALKDFLEQPRVSYVGADRATLGRAFLLAQALRHDVYDTYYLALALKHEATGLLTTDGAFQKLCKEVGLEYENPVPTSVLKRFQAYRPTGR
jgi:predicted nucleic acid-binding protein